jgi:hypothetical protein
VIKSKRESKASEKKTSTTQKARGKKDLKTVQETSEEHEKAQTMSSSAAKAVSPKKEAKSPDLLPTSPRKAAKPGPGGGK